MTLESLALALAVTGLRTMKQMALQCTAEHARCPSQVAQLQSICELPTPVPERLEGCLTEILVVIAGQTWGPARFGGS